MKMYVVLSRLGVEAIFTTKDLAENFIKSFPKCCQYDYWINESEVVR